MAQKHYIGEHYKDIIFRGSGKFYHQQGPSSFKELHLLKEESTDIIKRIPNSDEAKSDGIYLTEDNNSIIFVVDGKVYSPSGSISKSEKQDLTAEEERIFLGNIGLIEDSPSTDNPKIYFNTTDNTYYINIPKADGTFLSISLEAFLTQSIPNLDEDTIKSIVRSIRSSENLEISKPDYSVSVQGVSLYYYSGTDLLFEVPIHGNGWEIDEDGNLTVKSITIRGGGSDADAISFSDFLTIISALPSDITEEDFYSEYIKLFEALPSSYIDVPYGDYTIRFPLFKDNGNYLFNVLPIPMNISGGSEPFLYSEITFTFSMDHMEKVLEILKDTTILEEEKPDKIRELYIPECIYLKDTNGNESDFDFINFPSKVDIVDEVETPRWLFGDATNKYKDVKNTKALKGQVLNFTKTIDNLEFTGPYLECISAVNSKVTTSAISKFGVIHYSDLSGHFPNAKNFYSCHIKCYEFIGVLDNYRYLSDITPYAPFAEYTRDASDELFPVFQV